MTLPVGWAKTTLGLTCDLYQPQTISKSEMDVNGEHPVFGANGIVGRYHRFNHEEPQLLMTSRGATCGTINLSQPRSWITGNSMVIRPKTEEIDLRFLEYFLRGVADVASAISGSAQPQITRASLEPTTLILCPPTEQRRIVAKLDALTTRLARARAELHRVSVLASSWRKTKLAEAFTLSSAEAGQTTTSALCVSITDGDHQAPPKAATGIPFITISAMNDGRIDLTRATRFVPETYFSGLKEMRRPRKGDVLYSVTGSFGIPALVRSDDSFVFQRHIAILRPASNRCDPEWLACMLAAPQVRAQAAAVATGTAQMTVPLTSLRTFVLPDLKIAQQQEQVSRLSAAFARADRLEAEAARARALIDRLESAILAKAFRGELVPQDPNDEPASVLLDRIRAERAAAPKAKRGRRAKADA